MVESKELQLAKPIDTGNVILIIVYLAIIIVAAYFLTKFIAQRSLRKGMKNESRSKQSAFSQFVRGKSELGHLVSVVDRIPVDRDKTLMVVEFENKYYLIGTTADGFERIDSVDIPVAEVKPPPQPEAAEDGTPRAPANEEIPNEQDAAASATAPDEATFGNRFKKAFGIVLRSYLPKGARSKEMSFDEQLQARIKSDNDKAGKKSG